MIVPRAWTTIEYQRSAQQQTLRAKPTATDGRFKAASFFAFFAWCVICYSLRHSIHYYQPRSRGLRGFLHRAPTKHLLLIPLSLVVVGYSIALSFDWTISPLKSDSSPGWIYGLGYGPILVIILIFEIFGYIDENEDRVLIEQRRQRGRETDAELGIVKKPGWWSKRLGGGDGSNEDRLKAMTMEIGGGRATHKNVERGLELGNGPSSSVRFEEERRGGGRVEDPFLNYAAGGGKATTVRETKNDDRDAGNSPASSLRRSDASSTDTTSQVPATQIRSMLDV